MKLTLTIEAFGERVVYTEKNIKPSEISNLAMLLAEKATLDLLDGLDKSYMESRKNNG